MITVLVISQDDNFFSDLAAVGGNDVEIRIFRTTSGNSALAMILTDPFDLVVADEVLADMPGLELLKQVVALRPMLNCAPASGLAPEAFHDAGEGLGVLMQLPLKPEKRHAEQLFARLTKIQCLTGSACQA